VTWAKLDDQFHAHRKAKRAWRAEHGALGLHLLAMSYCAGHLTDGLVDDEFVEEKLPNTKTRDKLTTALVNAELWVREPDGWRINDWLDYNPSRADTLSRRRKDSDRKARGRATQSSGNPSGVHADTHGTSKRSPQGVCAASDGPVPSRPLTTADIRRGAQSTPLVRDAFNGAEGPTTGARGKAA
jgi:hypothetical protein